jgi:hypothetical protein
VKGVDGSLAGVVDRATCDAIHVSAPAAEAGADNLSNLFQSEVGS